MADSVQRRWDRYWARTQGDERDAAWLEPFAERLRGEGGPVLELGSGGGVDSGALAERGSVVALDYSRAALLRARKRMPAMCCVLSDLRDGLPFRTGAFSVVVASLCLHYFDSATTHRVLGETRRCLRPGGVLLARVNSIHDTSYGATGHRELEPHFYDVEGRPKRFFDEADLQTYFGAHFTLERMEHVAVGLSPEKWAFTVLAVAGGAR